MLSTRKRRLHVVVLLCFAAFSLLLYFKTTSYYFCSDTFDFLGPLSKANLDNALINPELSYTYRPVPRLSWLVFFTFFGRDPFWYHIINILTHALCGFLLSGFSGGASLNMGQEYLLGSIAVVVIGGTSVAGGKANVPGIWGAAMFMFLLVTMLNTFGASAGIRLIMTGVIIVAVITIAGGDKPQR